MTETQREVVTALGTGARLRFAWRAGRGHLVGTVGAPIIAVRRETIAVLLRRGWLEVTKVRGAGVRGAGPEIELRLSPLARARGEGWA